MNRKSILMCLMLSLVMLASVAMPALAEEDGRPYYLRLDPAVTGEIDVMVWSGDSTYHRDLGHQEIAPEDLTSQNVAAIYALAKEFNKLYPNVTVNLYAKTDDPNGNDTSWMQEIENFKAEHGKYPDVYAANDLPGDLSRGMIADLSVYADDPLYKTFNKGIMDTMNYWGFQAGLPQFMQPWGIFVNKELAEENNIDVPDPDWDIDEYTEFITSADNKNFYGTIFSVPTQIIDTGTTTVNAQMAAYKGEGDRVNIASDEVKDLIGYIAKWAPYEIWTLNGQGAVDASVMDDGWWWGYRFFCRNYVLAYTGDPWMMGAATAGKNDDGSWAVNAVESEDWDIYPRPATPYQPNTVGIVIDPMAIHNYAMDDGDPAWSDAEKDQFDLAYAFGSFWCFAQMDIWYGTDLHARYGDAEKMPGFQYLLKLWNDGQIWDISDKTYPYHVIEDGTQVNCLREWLDVTNADIAGAAVTDPSWVDTVKANLSDWNEKINARFRVAEQSITDGLITYYGYTDADF